MRWTNHRPEPPRIRDRFADAPARPRPARPRSCRTCGVALHGSRPYCLDHSPYVQEVFMSEPRDVLEGAGRQLLHALATAPEWADLDEEARGELEVVTRDLGKLLVLKLSGQDVDDEIAHAQAAAASWEFEAASQARHLLREALLGFARLAGEVIRAAAGAGA